MTAPAVPACPACSGPLIAGHPEGMVFDHHPEGCTLRPFEDSTRAADFDRTEYGRFSRPTSPTEQVLLGALGYVITPGEVTATVTFPAAAIRCRTFTGMRPTEPPPTPAPTTTPTEEGTTQ